MKRSPFYLSEVLLYFSANVSIDNNFYNRIAKLHRNEALSYKTWYKLINFILTLITYKFFSNY